MVFKIEDYPGRYVMKCDTREEFEAFAKHLHSVGRKWGSRDSYLTGRSTRINDISSTDCHYFNEGLKGSSGCAKDSDYIVLRYSDFDWDDEESELESDPEALDWFFKNHIKVI